MKRRELLKFLAAAPLLMQATGLQAKSQTHWQRRLVLVELKGGNDGLNTVIPFSDANYYALRPNLAIKREQVIQLTETTGLHPALKKFKPLWDNREIAIIQGLGYAAPNLSHFRSGDIWNTGSDSNVILEDGWLSQLFTYQPPPATFTADGIVMGSDIGPLAGEGTRSLVINDPQRFIHQARNLSQVDTINSNQALTHLLQIQESVQNSAIKLEHRLGIDLHDKDIFPETAIGRQLARAAQLLKHKVGTAVIKVSHGSFDTHTNQPAQHHRLLEQLADALFAFRQSMLASGQWGELLVMTYSEFGRRVAENGNHGTDHGTVAPHFILGGKVKGGIYGQPPSLTRLEHQNLIHTQDFRRLYATVAQWWGMESNSHPFAKYPPLTAI